MSLSVRERSSSSESFVRGFVPDGRACSLSLELSLGLGCHFAGLLSQMTAQSLSPQSSFEECELGPKILLWGLFLAIHDEENGENVPVPSPHVNLYDVTPCTCY